MTPSGHAVETGELRQFTTTTEGTGVSLLDERGWELVSPANKFGALIKGIGASGVVQASADGSRIAYSATGPLEQSVPANAGEAPALSLRGSDAWSTREIMPPDYPQTGPNVTGSKGLENRVFSSDLTLSIVDPFKEEPALSPLASERTPYLRDLNDVTCRITETTCYTPLVSGNGELADVTSGEPFGGPSTGQSGTFGNVVAVGATPDLQHVVLKSGVPLKSGLKQKSGIYEWSAASAPAERLQPVSILPNGEEATSNQQPALGEALTGRQNVSHAISDEGTFIVWSDEPTTRIRNLYLRDTLLGKTIRLDTPKAGEAEAAPGARFQTASADGKTIFFSDQQKLTSESTASLGKPDLYACHVHVAGSELTCPVEDLTGTAKEKNVGESANLQSMAIEASKDGSSIYFVANGVLSSNQNAHGEKATPGSCGENPPIGATCNLYVEHFSGSEWQEPTFIAALSADDGPDWAAKSTGTNRLGGGAPGGKEILLRKLTARVSPNGQFLAFMSDRQLTGYDNTDASPSAGGAADEEVFLYDATADHLVCASCNPSNERPHGVFDAGFRQLGPGELVVDRASNWAGRWLAGNVPGWTQVDLESSLHQSRYLSDEGRLFFNSADALVPQDKNAVEDVYEYELSGVGSCAVAGGCVGLISSGESTQESAFLDASESGADAFFLTTSKLLTSDIDQSYDIYDAHDCGLSPCLKPAVQTPPCSSSASCQGNSTSSTNFASPAAPGTPGLGNVLPQTITPKTQTLPAKTVKPTRAQLLSKALKKCKKLKKKSKRVACEKAAHKKYGPKKAKKSKKAARR